MIKGSIICLQARVRDKVLGRNRSRISPMLYALSQGIYSNPISQRIQIPGYVQCSFSHSTG